jgi:hypothetical protein
MTIIKNTHAKMIAERFETVMKDKGYAFFDGNLSWNLNLIGIRSNNKIADYFDDNILIIYRNDNKDWEVFSAPATTDPGKVPLLRPINKNGTAILVPNQYRGSHKIDLHAGKYLALRQSGGEVKVWRDNNRNKVLDMDDCTIQEGFFGINIHRANRRGSTAMVRSYSAGCQVFQKSRDFHKLMEICERSASFFGNSFTYTLLTEDDVS